jgi:hypothetical protein
MDEYVMSQRTLTRLTKAGRNKCNDCGKPFRVGDTVIITHIHQMNAKPHHKKCFERMLY